jgi:hypothetical protein
MANEQPIPSPELTPIDHAPVKVTGESPEAIIDSSGNVPKNSEPPQDTDPDEDHLVRGYN